MWMHNGGLGGWKQIKRRLGERLADKWYLGVVGGTDSEWAFALFLDTLERMGYDPSSQPVDGFSPTVLRKAMLKTIALINELIDSIPESTILAENVDTRSLLNFALSDGHTVICTRYVGSSSDEAASLYYSSGTLWETRVPDPDSRDYQMARSDMGADVVLVASEPLTFERGRQTSVLRRDAATDILAENWVNVPTNSILTIHNQTVLVHPILDQYYDRDPHHRRSAAFVRTKGLETNEKALARLGTPLVGTPGFGIGVETQKKLVPTIPFGVSRTRTPDTSGPTLPRVRTPLSRIEAASSHSQADSSDGWSGSTQQQVPIRSAQQQPPAQGNIKKKRASLQLEPSPVTPEPARTEFGNPNKIAQYFPELSMT